MSYLFFDKTLITNLEISLQKEFLLTNNPGCYSLTTIVGCNTRKYHGLLVCPMEEYNDENHVFLSSLDEEIIVGKQIFQLGIHNYPFVFSPSGHKYLETFELDKLPVFVYRIGDLLIKKEYLLAKDEKRILIKYTVLEAKQPFVIRFKPYLSYRQAHKLGKANHNVNTKYFNAANGIKYRMYNSLPFLFMQFSKKVDYIHVPDWYYNIEYREEQKRRYDFSEDLFVPGYFEMKLKKGEQLVFSAGLKETVPSGLKKFFEKEYKLLKLRNNFDNCLKEAAKQFIIKNKKRTEICAGYPWFGRWGRDTFIALPGLTLPSEDYETCKAVLKTMSKELNGCLFPNIGSRDNAVYNSVDAPLWYFWAVQQYAYSSGDYKTVTSLFYSKMKNILNGYRKGTDYNICMHDNGLIYAGEHGMALTWMDAVVDGKPVTPRIGFDVEINALWYNAVRFCIEIAEKQKDNDFIKEWGSYPDIIADSFKKMFTAPDKNYLADYAGYDYKDWSVRPNQVFATSLHYSPVGENLRKSILEVVKNELLTPKGLRTLSQGDPSYKEVYKGTQPERDLSYHQGTVWPWLLGHFAEGYLRIYKSSGIPFVQDILKSFEDDMFVHGIGTISEIYDGNSPHRAKGTISQAWSVSEILRIKYLIKKYKAVKSI